MIQILGWVGAGYVLREFFGGKGSPADPNAPTVEGEAREAPTGTTRSSGAAVAAAGPAAAEGAPAAGPSPALRPPLDPNLPLDPGIDEGLESSVLNALQSTDRRAVLGFADSMSNPQGSYGYFPIAAGVLRYHAAALARAEAIRAKQVAPPAPLVRPSVAGPPKASALPTP